jgi:competence protein ComGC/polyhydroxyalkanoate synthesis regulator phasin
LNISSNYDYGSQSTSTQELLKLLQKRNAQNSTSVQGLTSDNTSQTASEQKSVSPLADLVSAGTITSDQEQAIKEALETAKMAYQTQAGAASASSNSTFSDPLESLVSSGTITEDQKTAVKSALDSQKTQGMQGMPPPPSLQMSQEDDSDQFSSILDSLVTDGTLTEDQEDSILSALESASQGNTTNSSGTETSATEDTDPLGSLVTAGTITEDQKDAIEKAFEEAMSSQRMPPPPPPEISQEDDSDQLSSILDSLVTDGTLTADQEDSILSALESASQGNTTDSSGTETSTTEDTDPLDSLVTAGTITEDQKDAIEKAFEEAMSSQGMPPSPPPQTAQDESSDSLTSTLDDLVESGTITSDQQQYIQSAIQKAISAYSEQSGSYMQLLSNSYETGV